MNLNESMYTERIKIYLWQAMYNYINGSKSKSLKGKNLSIWQLHINIKQAAKPLAAKVNALASGKHDVVSGTIADDI